jgi:hypothetical protein
MTSHPHLRKRFPDTSSEPESTELQFMEDEINRLSYLVRKFEDATKNQIIISQCGCRYLNDILIEWCGDHY